MRKIFFTLFAFSALILGACSDTSNELAGDGFSVFTWSPDIAPGDIPENIVPTSHTEFNFKSSDEVEMESGGETFTGNYTLKNNTLNISLMDGNGEASLALEFSDFIQHEESEDLYTGTLSKLDLKNDGYHRMDSNFSFGEYLGFYKGN